MSNDYYKAGSLAEHTLARASQINAQFQSIEAAFDKLPEADALKQGRILYAGTDTGAADVYVVSLPYPPASYEDGLQFRFRPANSNTGPSTVNVNGLGVKPITRYDGSDLEAADIPAGGIVELSYDGEKFRLTTFHASALELARDWATKADDVVLGGEYSAKAYASSEGLIPTGSAKEHAQDAAESAGAAADSAAAAAGSAASAAASAAQAGQVAGDLQDDVQAAINTANEAKGIAENHNHDGVYSPIGHNHDAVYAGKVAEDRINAAEGEISNPGSAVKLTLYREGAKAVLSVTNCNCACACDCDCLCVDCG